MATFITANHNSAQQISLYLLNRCVYLPNTKHASVSKIQNQFISIRQEEIGDHIMFIGEIIEITADENIRPLVYHNGKYWKLGDNLPSPRQEILDGISN